MMQNRFPLLTPFVVSLLFSSVSAISQATPQPKDARPSQGESAQPLVNVPHLDTKQITLPLAIVNGFPFLEGSINGKRGKLLFDVGEASAFTLDSHTVTPPNGVVVGHGYFGSGQTFEVMQYPVIDKLTLAGGLEFKAITNIRGNPGLPLEQHITPDFIGWIGVKFWEGSVFKLDYAKATVTFFPDGDGHSGERKAEAGEHVALILSVSRASNGLLYFPVKIGSLVVTATLDTGSHDHAWMTDKDVDAMERAGTLHEETNGKFTISDVTIDGHPVPPTQVEITRGRAPFAKSMPQPDAPLYQFAYEFLSRQVTVWDYGHNTVTLLTP